MTQIHHRLALMGMLVSLFAASPVWAWHIDGQVFCDENGNQTIDGGDSPLNGVEVLITALTASPGTTYSATTGSGNGSYNVPLPDNDEDYRVELTGSGLPLGANTIVPAGGAYTIHLQSDASEATANFLVDGCVATPTPSSTPTATETPVPTVTETPAASPTATPDPSDPATPVPTATPTVTKTATPTLSATPTAAGMTATPTPTKTATSTPVGATATPTPVSTAVTPTPTTPTATETPTSSPTPTATPTETSTPTPPEVTTTPFENTFTPTPTDPATPTPSPTPELNHFQCYEVHGAAAAIPGVALVDAYGASTVNLVEPRRFCAPADKNGEDPTAPSDPDHLTGYKLKQTSPPVTKHRGQVVTDQFGTLVVDVSKPEYLLVPSSKSLSGPPAPLASPAVDHFKCYKVTRARLRMSGIQVEDQFGPIVVKLTRPLRLCTAADKNGEGVLDPSANLMCYKVKVTSASSGAPGTVFIDNQFGPDDFLLTRRTELCVPASLTVTP